MRNKKIKKFLKTKNSFDKKKKKKYHKIMESQKNLPSIKEIISNQRELRILLETYAINGLGKGVYEKRQRLEKPEVPEDADTISRLEALSTPPEIKEERVFLGVFLPLGMGEEDDWLFISPDGTIIRWKPPSRRENSYNFRGYLQDFYTKASIMLDEGEDIFDYLCLKKGGEVVYRTDYPLTDWSSFKEKVEEDLKEAQKVALARQKLIAEQKKWGVEVTLSILDIFGPSHSDSNSSS